MIQRFALTLVLFVLFVAFPTSGLAHDPSEPRASIKDPQATSQGVRLRYAPLSLPGGAHLTLISPQQWSPLADKLSQKLTDLHDYFTSVFGTIPPFTTSIRLMDNEVFYRETGAPEWTNAMYYRGQIIIPLTANEPIDMQNMNRSIRHEYAHAVIAALSKGKCPGWLDEGLAQWAEGKENPALKPALVNWLESRRPVPLSLLQGGFTKLQSDMVPAAYAQSLFAANTLISTYGLSRIREYFDNLSVGDSKKRAFEHNFHLSETRFEQKLGKVMKSWAEKHKEPHYR